MRTLGPILIAIALAQANCAAPRSAPTECAVGPFADGLEPSRGGFFRELLFAQGTARTPRFDDYTPTSYHVDKLDLATGLPAAARECGLQLRALIILGPMGPLWTYHVLTFLADGASIRVNVVTMPHARVTYKGTAQLAPNALAALFTQVEGMPVLRRGPPTPLSPPPGGDFSYDFLAVRFSNREPEFWHGLLSRATDTVTVAKLTRRLSDLIARAMTTYEHIM